jgi:Transglutaminase-like superfamily
VSEAPLSWPGKAGLVLRIWSLYPQVVFGLRREQLPAYVAKLGESDGGHEPRSPAQLSRAVDRSLRLGSRRPRCLVSALVLYRLLREQGDEAELVIGLPQNPADKDAHAWVELAGADVGPPPGKGRHEELARFPTTT